MSRNYRELIKRAEQQLMSTEDILDKIHQKEMDSLLTIDEKDSILTKITKINALLECKEQEKQVIEVQIKIYTLIHNLMTAELGRLDLEVDKINDMIGGIEEHV